MASRRRVVTAVAAVCLLASLLPDNGAGAQSAPANLVSTSDITERDNLIDSQESLLNVYRCQFDIDTHIVPGGCSNGAPRAPRGPVPRFSGFPTTRELLVREQLIAFQESLLNVYRCQFDIDTHIVPQGCLWGKPRLTSASQAQRNAYKFTAVSAGAFHACGIHIDRTTEFSNVVCWGDDSAQQLNPWSGRFIHLASGGWHSCAIYTDQAIYCWGLNDFGQLHAPEGRFTALDSGGRHSCAIRDDFTATCWGNNTFGQVDAPAGKFTDISAGSFHSCVLRDDLTIACWGDNQFGQADPPAGKFTDISVSQTYSCAIGDDFTVACWGGNEYGQANPPAGLVPIQVVYAVPSDVEPLVGRDLAIAEEVSEIQAWFRGQTGGRHPMIKVDDSSISVITVRLSRTASEISEVDGLLLEELAVDDIYQQIGARRDTFLLIYFEGEAEFDRADTTCGWTVNGYVFFPMGNCSLEPMTRSPEPAGSAELVARQIVHLLRGLLTCAPNHNEESPWTVTDSSRDLLYSWTNWSLWPNLVLDFGNDDYYMIGESECPDLAHDPLLVLE